MMNEKKKAAILEKCIAQFQSGAWTREECLRRYPNLAVEIGDAIQLAGTFQTMRNGMAASSEMRLAKVKLLNRLPDREELVTKSHPARYTWQTTKRRFAMTWIIIISTILTMMTGTGVVYASNDALPGDALYPVKALTENVQLALGSDESDAQLTLKLVETRMEEVQALLEKGRVDDLDEAVSGYENQTQAMLKLLANVQAHDPDEALRLRTELEQKLQEQAHQVEGWLDDEETLPGDRTRAQLQDMLQTNTQTRLRVSQVEEEVPPEDGTEDTGDVPEESDLTSETTEGTTSGAGNDVGNGTQMRSAEFISASGDNQIATFTFRVANAAQNGVYAELNGSRYTCTADGDLVNCNIPNAVEKGTLKLYCLEDNSFLYSHDYDYDWLGTKEPGPGENGQMQQGGSEGSHDNGDGGSGKGGK